MNKREIAFWIMFILVICLVIYSFFWINSESYKCMNNPLVYGVSLFYADKGEFTCQCSSPNSKVLYVTKENISILDINNLFTTNQ